VHAHCAVGERYFTDFLTFVKVDDAWRIISKVFHFDLLPSDTDGPDVTENSDNGNQ